ncbi:BRO family, N-terminal domain [Paramuricea clavata]|uniref:BRO family, N-terminal domain n=1 Tax=Paramuricea clavata TaxID=317549 RepID=A0A6S7FHC8_PARCT|nr:BRO family, N-terminal domain [Paramuricea clavata]
MEQLFRNQKLNVSVRTVKSGEEVLFYAKDVAESLVYSNTKKAVRNHVWEEDKCTLGSIQKGALEGTLSGGHPGTVLITEQGLYQLIFGLELNTAKEFRRNNHPNAVIVPGLGEYQDTESKRCDAWKKGFKGGQPDLIIENPMGEYTGFAIELKSPKGTGTTSEKQVLWLKRLREIGYMTVVSDDLIQICIRINEYFSLKKKVKIVRVKNVVSEAKL